MIRARRNVLIGWVVVWVGAFLFGGLLGCDEPAPSPSKGSRKLPNGRMLFVEKCALCHGEDGRGNMMGPDLSPGIEHWTEEALIAYIPDAEAYAAESPRLLELREKHSPHMTKFPDLTPDQLTALARFVLTIKSSE